MRQLKTRTKTESTVTLPKSEYQMLTQIAERYYIIQKVLFFEEPPIRGTNQVINEFRKTGLYNEAFLKSLEKGLKESPSFF